MSSATVRLLEAAAEVLGGPDRLAQHLNITDFLLQAYLEDRRPLPDLLLLRAVDLVLNNLERRVPADPHAVDSEPQRLPDLKS